jgi:hypothetical protein
MNFSRVPIVDIHRANAVDICASRGRAGGAYDQAAAPVRAHSIALCESGLALQRGKSSTPVPLIME